uniref:mRNA-degrading endonuclease RelE, toxin component of the RelBE toxin-antitoxin system n=1 Tax=Candidatus Kentrum sp. LPFa TaxID=2126335 RepID=A0A450W0D0_9GAMM|nr:MAG: hypothetical protein BECKLPF1236A_GA0070988_100393 [Candidatus Kentron sp. LPFa]VFK26826.1 MAG: hypothetical protein BECKLPF1236C_GA0070990_100393 [Candidatus Kentron sp. LPFa]
MNSSRNCEKNSIEQKLPCMWKLHVSRSFERAIRQIPREYQRRIVAWHDEHVEGISNLANIDKVVWLTKERVFGRIRFGRYRLGLIVDREHTS